MRVFGSIRDWLEFRETESFDGRTLGFVPTMGALHDGHAALMEKSRAENDFTLASIFINPTQFNDARDFETYPAPLEEDLETARRAGVNFLLLPRREEIYPDGYRYRISETDLSRELCGAHRPGHFDGVLTVVMKLLQIARADRAYFGEKDYQQYLLIRGLAEAFFLRTRIVPVPTIRESDGLALSSRNRRLSEEARTRAPEFSRTLLSAAGADEARGRLMDLGFGVDYVEDREGRRFAAVRIEDVRLIDNVKLPG